MTGFLIDSSGQKTKLPPFLSWNVTLTDGEPCDSFCVRFCFERALLPALEQACRFEAVENTATVFFGVVDDFSVTLDKKGLLCELSGRSLAALLLDNQVPAAEFVSAQARDILQKYAQDFGVDRILADDMPPIANFLVETGCTCWQVLCSFCRHSAGILPRFLPDGTLVLKRAAEKGVAELRQPILSFSYTQKRYGVLTKQVIIPTGKGTPETAQNAVLQALGGSCGHYGCKNGQKLRVGYKTASQRIADSIRDFRVLRVTLPGSFLAVPGQLARLSLPQLGDRGNLPVYSVESVGDENGVLCTLELGG